MPRELKELIAHPVRVRRRMTKLGHTNRSLAEQIGCSVAVVGKLLCGMNIRTSAENADAFEKELQVEAGTYFVALDLIADCDDGVARGSTEAAPLADESQAAAVDAA